MSGYKGKIFILHEQIFILCIIQFTPVLHLSMEFIFYFCTMETEAELAILDENTLLCVGLRTLIHELAPGVTVRTFSSFTELMCDVPFGYVHYFVSYSIYFQHVDFFQQLGPRVILLANNTEQSRRFRLPTLDVSLSEALLIRQIMHLRQQGGRNNESRKSEMFHGPDFGTRRIPHSPQAQPDLSAREIEVLSLLVQGLTNKEIAHNLHISPTTVITHRKNIQEKTGCKSLAGLTVYAILNQYVRVEDI